MPHSERLISCFDCQKRSEHQHEVSRDIREHDINVDSEGDDVDGIDDRRTNTRGCIASSVQILALRRAYSQLRMMRSL